MSTVLIWSVESVLLGLWALALSSYSTPVHVFVARSHVLISSFTLILHLYIKARDLTVGSAVAQSFCCAVTALFLVYLSMVLGSSSADKRFFSMPAVGVVPLDACIGLGWFAAAFISSVGMALSFTPRKAQPSGDAQNTSSLMLHPYGVHHIVLAPCFALAFSVGYSWLAAVVAWLVYVFCMAVLIFVSDDNHLSRTDNLSAHSPTVFERSAYFAAFIYSKAFLLLVVVFLLGAPLSVQQQWLVVCLLILAGGCFLSVFSYIHIPFFSEFMPTLTSLDGFFGRRVEAGGSSAAMADTAPSAPPLASIILPAIHSIPVQSRFTYYPPSSPPRMNLGASLADPAAVALSRRHLVVDRLASFREKAF